MAKRTEDAYYASTFFNWRCKVCLVLAYDPHHLESQHLFVHGPYTDSSEPKQWLKCNKCCGPFHAECLGLVGAQVPQGKWYCVVCRSEKLYKEAEEAGEV
jgi:hypothetical protein